ncbi:hypothetical protein CFOL_v3_21436 [Cephalotus follicularis]|uniref:Putative plant transposon protein domain-containing protein n=1 Tax=Cephalotus follicularis TaxID=3775 RepID=A0A1Q3CCX6_CEPFO|nr:hypothetical protein CFOL_v3_21436 [Cephalotus follicularis]
MPMTKSMGKKNVASSSRQEKLGSKRKLDLREPSPDPALQSDSESEEVIPLQNVIFVDKRVMGGWNIDLAFCSHEFVFVPWLQNLYLLPLVQIQDMYYIKLIKEFYRNLRIVSSPHEEFALSSSVKGQRIFLDARILASILIIPHTSLYVFEYKKWPEVKGFHLNDILSILYPNEHHVHPNLSLCTNKLSVNHRLLHHLIVQQLLPTSGGYAKLTRMQAFLMWCIISKVEFSYPLLMLHTMVHAFSQKKFVLPFGCNLTKLFSRYEINLEGEIGTKLTKEDTYSKSTLNCMGWEKQDGSWIYCPRSDQSLRIDKEQHEEIPPWEGQEAAPSHSHTRGSSSTTEYDRIVDFMSARSDAMNARFDSMEAPIDGNFKILNSRLDHFEKDHKMIRTDFETIEDTIYYELDVNKRHLKHLEWKLAESKMIYKCEETFGDESAPDSDPSHVSES